jgi:hypothetical protein
MMKIKNYEFENSKIRMCGRKKKLCSKYSLISEKNKKSIYLFIERLSELLGSSISPLDRSKSFT